MASWSATVVEFNSFKDSTKASTTKATVSEAELALPVLQLSKRVARETPETTSPAEGYDDDKTIVLSEDGSRSDLASVSMASQITASSVPSTLSAFIAESSLLSGASTAAFAASALCANLSGSALKTVASPADSGATENNNYSAWSPPPPDFSTSSSHNSSSSLTTGSRQDASGTRAIQNATQQSSQQLPQPSTSGLLSGSASTSSMPALDCSPHISEEIPSCSYDDDDGFDVTVCDFFHDTISCCLVLSVFLFIFTAFFIIYAAVFGMITATHCD
jgi:hypothetical protein